MGKDCLLLVHEPQTRPRARFPGWRAMNTAAQIFRQEARGPVGKKTLIGGLHAKLACSRIDEEIGSRFVQLSSRASNWTLVLEGVVYFR